MDLVLRFLIGGVIVSAFAMAGDLFTPRSFAGLFGAAPSVALATLTLTAGREGTKYAAAECRSMLIGAAALGLCAWVVCRLLVRKNLEPLPATIYGIGVWCAAALGMWWELLR